MDNPLKFLAALDRMSIYDTPRFSRPSSNASDTCYKSTCIPLENMQQVNDTLPDQEAEASSLLKAKIKIRPEDGLSASCKT